MKESKQQAMDADESIQNKLNSLLIFLPAHQQIINPNSYITNTIVINYF
jgi:hypothetical protein